MRSQQTALMQHMRLSAWVAAHRAASWQPPVACDAAAQQRRTAECLWLRL